MLAERYLIDFAESKKQAKPFVKWAGGKQQLLTQFVPYFPCNFERYFEPFVGGGALFFHLWNLNKLPREIFLFDNNEELINTYLVVRDKIDELIAALAEHKRKHGQRHYYETRSLDRHPAKLSDVARAARTIYLNKTCYNGLYRVNSKGEFNVPMGSYKRPTILDEDNLRAASTALQKVVIEARDFRELPDLAKSRDFFYFDPPYDPLSKTASFTGYTPNNFREQDQRDLAVVFAELTQIGCLCMLSNSDTDFIRNLYSPFRIEIVFAKRAVNSVGKGRGAIKEMVVLNYLPVRLSAQAGEADWYPKSGSPVNASAIPNQNQS